MTLTNNQEKALNSLLAGNSAERAAVAAGVSRSTIWRWQKEEPFSTAFKEIRHQDFVHALGRLKISADNAVSTLVSNLNCGDPSREIRAAVTILKQAMRAAEQELQGRLEKAEAMLEKMEHSLDTDATPGPFHAQIPSETFQNVANVAASRSLERSEDSPEPSVSFYPIHPANPVKPCSSTPQAEHSATSEHFDAQISPEAFQNVANVAPESVTPSNGRDSGHTHPQTDLQTHPSLHPSNPVNPVKSLSSPSVTSQPPTIAFCIGAEDNRPKLLEAVQRAGYPTFEMLHPSELAEATFFTDHLIVVASLHALIPAMDDPDDDHLPDRDHLRNFILDCYTPLKERRSSGGQTTSLLLLQSSTHSPSIPESLKHQVDAFSDLQPETLVQALLRS